MSFPFTTYSDISPRTNLYASTQFLEYAIPNLVLERYATVKALPSRSTVTIKFRRCVPFDVSTTPLQEGVTPQPQSIQYEDVETTIKQYGAWCQLTDVIQDTHEDPVLQQMTKLMSEQASQTREAINWGVFRAGTSVYYSSTTASPTLRTQVNAPMTLQLERKVTTLLDRNFAKKIKDMQKPSTDVGTVGVPSAYIGICHTDVRPDLFDMPRFTKTVEFGSGKAEPFEIGSGEEIRYVASAFLSPILAAGSTTLNGMRSVGLAAVDVYPILVIAEDSIGVVPLKGVSDVMLHVKNPGKPSDSDPLGQRGFVSWKMWHAALILNQNWISRVEVGATA